MKQPYLAQVRMQLLIFAVLSLLLAACAASVPMPAAPAQSGDAGAPATTAADGAPETNLTEGCVENYDPTIDYFPEKINIEYARGFTVEYFDNYKVVTVTEPWQGAEESYQYVLVQCGTPAPAGYDGAAVIEVPVQRVIALSTTYLPHLESLGLVDRLVGIDNLLWTTTPSVRERIEAGEVVAVGTASNINVEQVLDLEPDLIMTFSIGIPEWDTSPALQEAGLPVVLNGDFVEQDPLGRTEWMKFLSLFFNTEGEAQAQFATIAEEYNRIAALTRDVEERPTVLLSSIYDGTWWMAGGESYMAQLIEDAGATYLWADESSTASVPLDFETVFDRAADADYWINPDNTFWLTVEDVLASDERYGDFAALQAGRLYNNNAIVNENGGNAFYESGAANPHVVLKDLVKIFHPELLPEHELVYYRQVE